MPPLDKEGVERTCVRLRGERCAPPRGHCDDPQPAFGQAQDAAERGHALFFAIGGGRLVGRDHTVFVQFLGAMFCSTLRSVSTSPSKTARGSIVSTLKAPWWCRRALSRCATWS